MEEETEYRDFYTAAGPAGAAAAPTPTPATTLAPAPGPAPAPPGPPAAPARTTPDSAASSMGKGGAFFNGSSMP
jgi:hypothetical protein